MSDSVISMINGQLSSNISIVDRGFNYGDGVFETMALINASIPLWALHRQRLLAACERLKIPLDIALLSAQLQKFLSVCSSCSQHRGVVKLVVTRGSGGRGYEPPLNPVPTICFSFYATDIHLNSQTNTAVELGICQLQLAGQPLLAGIKHLNRLENVLARQEMQQQGLVDGVVCSQSGLVIETTAANVFLVKNDQLITPALSQCGVAGVVRELIKTLCQDTALLPPPLNSLSFHEADVSMAMLLDSDEIFISNSVWGVRPVSRCGSRTWALHPVALTLQKHIAAHVLNAAEGRVE